MCIICEKNINDLINTTKLILKDCYNITEIPKELVNLKELIIIKCYNINYIPKELINLEILHIHYYNKIKYIPLEIINLKDLQFDFHYFSNESANYFYSTDSIEIKKIIKYLYYL
jgi:hypothetical protein